MRSLRKKEAAILVVGDLLILVVSLVLTLFARYGEIDDIVLALHLTPFLILFAASFLVFFVMGLYEKHTRVFKQDLPKVIIKSQFINAALAIALFYFVPSLIITPKANLFIYIVISSVLVTLWRSKIAAGIIGKKSKERAIIIGAGGEIDELMSELNHNDRSGLVCFKHFNPDLLPLNIEEITSFVERNSIRSIILASDDPRVGAIMPSLYKLLFKNIEFISFYSLYEEIFDREPVSLVDHSWFIDNISANSGGTYSFVKRTADIIASFATGLVSLIFYPFVYLAIKLEDGGPIFIYQDRIGQNGKPIRIIKFRSMSGNDNGKYTSPDAKTVHHVTKVGAVLRFTRIDELPQLWNVFRGDLSLIGPRPELPSLVEIYEREVPHYQIRHLVKPGLSGWAQVYHKQHPHHGVNTVETKNKLSYDLYYIKHRSAMLDLKIALRTLQILMSKVGV